VGARDLDSGHRRREQVCGELDLGHHYREHGGTRPWTRRSRMWPRLAPPPSLTAGELRATAPSRHPLTVAGGAARSEEGDDGPHTCNSHACRQRE
jgi:hypothetical protein